MILPSVIEEIIIEYKDQMEHIEKVERVYQTAFRNMSRVFCAHPGCGCWSPE